MNQERTYLDTNIIFHRKVREENIIAIIESAIGSTFKYCSAFVVSEHKRVFLQTMRLMWTFFKEKKDTEEVSKSIETHPWKSKQEKDRSKKIFNWITDYGKSAPLDAVRRLENLIFSYETFFFEDIDVLESEVDCPLARMTINSRERITNVSLRCVKRCSMSSFLKSQKAKLLQIQRLIEDINHLQLVVAILKRVSNNPEEYDESICRTLADVIIVLEAPENFLVCSNNIRDFEPICKALEVRFLPIEY
ncbi:MAG: hypothetical protein WBA22_07445 [Candidatus Methanofastidiosia archaeon]